MIYAQLDQLKKERKKSFALLIDPDKPQKEELVALEVLEKDLTAVAAISENKNAKENSISVEPARNIETQKESRVSPNPEAQVDQILASFTSAELSAVGRNTEQDIYLDLYN